MSEQDSKTGVTVRVTPTIIGDEGVFEEAVVDEFPTATHIRVTQGILEVWHLVPGDTAKDQCLGVYSVWIGARNHGQGIKVGEPAR